MLSGSLWLFVHTVVILLYLADFVNSWETFLDFAFLLYLILNYEPFRAFLDGLEEAGHERRFKRR